MANIVSRNQCSRLYCGISSLKSAVTKNIEQTTSCNPRYHVDRISSSLSATSHDIDTSKTILAANETPLSIFATVYIALFLSAIKVGL